MSILITGGAGFIGSHLTRLLVDRGEEVAVLDKLTYAGNLDNLRGCWGHPGFGLYLGDVCNRELVEHAMKEAQVDRIIHLAAETHVDRSIEDASAFLETNILGTHNLLEMARESSIKKFLLVSTDEVYGEVLEGEASEACSIRPRNPYSASKAGQEHLVYSYWNTYGLPAVIIRGCNNYGPRQHPEKFIPTVITRALEDKSIPLYGDGSQTREWIHVEDFVEAVVFILKEGVPGQTYNVGTGIELRNIELVRLILNRLGKPEGLITHVQDRPGHDKRYAMDSTKIISLGWQSKIPFEVGMRGTISWYREKVIVHQED